MKQSYAATAMLLAMTSMNLQAQSLFIHTGSVTTAIAPSAGDITFLNAETLVAQGISFPIASIDSITTSALEVEDNTIAVQYNGTAARVVIAGNIAPLVTTTVSGAHVSIIQDTSLAQEITYTLSGTSTAGSFYMDGDLKATVVLDGLNLTSETGAAIDIACGKRIAVVLSEGTENVLADVSDGTHKGCFQVNGHTEFQQAGSLTITGNTKHAFFGDEYVELKASAGVITIEKSVKDGFNVNQYFKMKGGTIVMRNVGDDCLQVSTTNDATDELNGEVIIDGGTLNLTATATAAKGIKCDSHMTINGGTLNIVTTGGAAWDSDDADVKGAAALSADGDLIINGGDMALKCTGAGGKGMSGDRLVAIHGGNVNVTTTGKQYVTGSYDCLPKGVKADGNLMVTGGVIAVNCTGGEGAEGLESKDSLLVSGGELTINTYDDAINASNNVSISGGKIYVHATNNDGIDSNGTLNISGGTIIAIGTTSPEEGFDCDQNSFSITGGTVLGIGGSTSTPTASVTTQPVIVLGGKSLQNGTTLSLSGADGSIYAFTMPKSLNQASLLMSSPALSVGSSYTVSSGVTTSAATMWNGFMLPDSTTGGTTLATLTLSSVVTTSGNSGGGPGGGGGPGWRP